MRKFCKVKLPAWDVKQGHRQRCRFFARTFCVEFACFFVSAWAFSSMFSQYVFFIFFSLTIIFSFLRVFGKKESQPTCISLSSEVVHVSWLKNTNIAFFLSVSKTPSRLFLCLFFLPVWVFHHCKNFCLQYCPVWWLTCAHKGNNSNEEARGCR